MTQDMDFPRVLNSNRIPDVVIPAAAYNAASTAFMASIKHSLREKQIPYIRDRLDFKEELVHAFQQSYVHAITKHDGLEVPETLRELAEGLERGIDLHKRGLIPSVLQKLNDAIFDYPERIRMVEAASGAALSAALQKMHDMPTALSSDSTVDLRDAFPLVGKVGGAMREGTLAEAPTKGLGD